MDQINYTNLVIIASITMLILYSLSYTYPVLILSGWLLLLYIMSILYVFIVAPVNQLLLLLYWVVKTPVLFLCGFFMNMEKFDAEGLVYMPVGEERHGLRGDLLNRLDISRNYIRPDRHIRLSRSNDIMYESDVPPYMEGLNKCQKVECPNNGYFDKSDTCWKC